MKNFIMRLLNKYFTRLLIGSILFFSMSSIYATYDVYLYNNTSYKWNISSSIRGKYKGVPNHARQTFLLPYESKKVYEFNYDKGIKRGKDYIVKTRIDSDKTNPITFEIMIHGDTIGSSITGAYTEAKGKKYSFFTKKQTFRGAILAPLIYPGDMMTLWCYFAKVNTNSQSVDTIVFGIDKKDTESIINTGCNEAVNDLNILTYNTQLMPFYCNLSPNVKSNCTLKRAELIPPQISNFDIVSCQELFDRVAREKFCKKMAENYSYSSGPIFDKKILSGGCMIFSKWPIIKSDKATYGDYNGSDGWAAKGIVYANIKKGEQIYHIFATHTQAWDDVNSVIARAKQVNTLNQFIIGKNIPEDEPIIVLGDLNINYYRYDNEGISEEGAMLLRVLKTDHTLPINGKILPFTSDFSKNSMVCSSEQKLLDYIIFPTRKNIAIFTEQNRIIVFRSPDMHKHNNGTGNLNLDLSDHFGLASKVTWMHKVVHEF
jgi:endonuclease/exonuclease/phosphatase family metal-dependent hydrolase